jgi:hypothetical protein
VLSDNNALNDALNDVGLPQLVSVLLRSTESAGPTLSCCDGAPGVEPSTPPATTIK